MLKVELYSNPTELYQCKFLLDPKRVTTIVVPSPYAADELRKRVSGIDIITISGFIKQEMLKGLNQLRVVRKDDLMLRMATKWREFFLSFPPEAFFQAFDIFTELRSFTVNYELISNVLDEFDPVVATAIKVFWHHLEGQEIVDEQTAYALLAQAYRAPEHVIHQSETNIILGRNLIFWGFKHLSAGQIDLLQALSIRHDVYVPFPNNAFALSQDGDWIRWLCSDKIVPTCKRHKKCHIMIFPRNRLNQALKSWDNKQKVNVFLGTKNPDYNQILEIPFQGCHFKSAAEIFSYEIKELGEQLRDRYFFQAATCDLLELNRFLEELGRTALQQHEFIRLKVISLFQELISQVQFQQDQFEMFDLKLFEQVLILRMPRVFVAPILTQQVRGNIYGLEALDSFNSQVSTVICATSGYGPMKGDSDRYSEEVMKFLLTIGPVKRKELEFLLLKESLLEMLGGDNTVLFIEQGLREVDLGWEEILASFEELQFLPNSAARGEFRAIDHLRSDIVQRPVEVTQMSATRLQTFINCPRLYYFKYIEKISAMPQVKISLRPDQLGALEHKIIESYFKSETQWISTRHTELVETIFQQFILENQLQLDELVRQKALVELRNYSQNGIVELLKLKMMGGESQYLFEYKLKDSLFRGSVDALILGEWGAGLLDFKRSKSSIPAKNEVNEFMKIQLWFYLAHLPEFVERLVFWGYVNLSEPGESLLYVTTKQMAERLQSISFLDKSRFEIVGDNWQAMLSNYRQRESELLDRLAQENEFLPIPLNDSVCQYCNVNQLCPRRILE